MSQNPTLVVQRTLGSPLVVPGFQIALVPGIFEMQVVPGLKIEFQIPVLPGLQYQLWPKREFQLQVDLLNPDQ